MSQPGQAARKAAVHLMTEVTANGRLLSELLPGALDKLEPAERARAQRLATESLRWAQRSDRLLGPFLRMKPEDEVMNALRLALMEIFVDQTPSHAAVNGAVSMTSRSKSGLVNAVLRNVLRGEPDWGALPVPSLPKWLRKPLIAAWGKPAVEAMEAVHAAGAPLDLTPKSGDAAALAAALGGTDTGTGSVRLSGSQQVSALPGYQEGDWWVQDAAAALPTQILAVAPGERVLDLCAAPGGKTLQLAAAGADVTAIDISARRMEVVAENLARTGLAAKCEVVDALEFEAPPFDAILLDAPCSATGTLRRHPDLAFAKSAELLTALTGTQNKLFDKAVSLLAPGGRLVVCTCSLLPSEGEELRAAALARHADLQPRKSLPARLDRGDWIADLGALRLRPDMWADRGGMDGFYIASFEKSP